MPGATRTHCSAGGTSTAWKRSMLVAMTSRPSRSDCGSWSRAARSRSAGTRRAGSPVGSAADGGRPPPKRALAARSAASPPSRTASTMARARAGSLRRGRGGALGEVAPLGLGEVRQAHPSQGHAGRGRHGSNFSTGMTRMPGRAGLAQGHQRCGARHRPRRPRARPPCPRARGAGRWATRAPARWPRWPAGRCEVHSS